MPFFSILLLIGVGLLLAVGDFLMKEWAERSGAGFQLSTWFFSAIVCYIIGLTFYAVELKKVDFAAASYFILLFNMIFVASIGYIFFQDHASRLEILGICFGLLAVLCFSFSRS
jgi:drug/metabolite transporter (DMT)-like permease